MLGQLGIIIVGFADNIMVGHHSTQELAAAYYLITGVPLQYGAASVVLPRLPYRELLRRSYHAAACNGLNYARAADATMDICLQRLLQRFSNESYAAADRLLLLLSQLS